MKFIITNPDFGVEWDVNKLKIIESLGFIIHDYSYPVIEVKDVSDIIKISRRFNNKVSVNPGYLPDEINLRDIYGIEYINELEIDDKYHYNGQVFSDGTVHKGDNGKWNLE